MADYSTQLLAYVTTAPYYAGYSVDSDSTDFVADVSLDTTFTGTTSDCAVSPTGRWLAFARTNTPRMALYERDGKTYNLRDNPADFTDSTAYALGFSPDGKYVAIGGASPFLQWYRCDVDPWVKMPAPATATGGVVQSIQWSPDSQYLLLGLSSGSYFAVYRVDDGELVRLANPPSPGAAVNKCCWAVGGSVIVICQGTGSYLRVYSFQSEAITELPLLSDRPTSQGYPATTPNGDVLFVGYGQVPFLKVYQWNGLTFVPVTLPSLEDRRQVVGATVSPDGKYLATARGADPRLVIYEIDGTTLTEIPPVTSPGIISALGFSPKLIYGVGLVYNSSVRRVVDKSLDFSSLKIALLDDTAVFAAGHTTLAEVTDSGTKEVHGFNWPEGGVLIDTVAVDLHGVRGAKITASRTTGTVIGGSLTFRAAVIYDDSTVNKTPFMYIPIEENKTAEEGDLIEFVFNSSGMINFE